MKGKTPASPAAPAPAPMGASQIAARIIPTIEASGGAVLVQAEVDQILTHRGRVTGVRMINGDEIVCAQVISAAGVHTTWSRLLSPWQLRSSWVAPLEPLSHRW